MLGKLKKLKGRSFAEIKDRGRQSASVLAERFAVAPHARIPSDERFFRLLNIDGKNISGETLLDHLRSREVPQFYSSFDDPDATIGVLRQRFPEEIQAIIERADRIREGYFDLLGYENLYFETAIPNWHFEPVTKKMSPMVHWSLIDETDCGQTGDKKIVWELNRHQYFSTLGRAYWITKDEKYAETFVLHLEDWIAKNPPKMGLNWMSSLEIAFRSMSWIWALHFFKHSPTLTPEVFVQTLKVLHLNGRHLESYLSTYSSPNTHLTGEALGLYFLGTFLPEFSEANKWKDVGYEILLKALDFQIRNDGVFCEQTSHYHRYTTDFYTTLMILRQVEGLAVDEKHYEKLRQMLEFLIFITQPNGETPLLGDDDGGRLHFLDERPVCDFRSTLAIGAALFDDERLKFVAKDASAELLWLLGPRGLVRFDEIPESEPTEKVKAFASSGFFTVRDSWEDQANALFIDCGEHGFLNGGHAHADALHFVLSVDGLPVFVDAGTYNYTSDPKARELFRSTVAHNCLTVNGESSSIPNGPFSWKRSAAAKLLEWSNNADGVIFRGSHDGFYRFGVIYEREIRFNRGNIIVNDNIKSNSLNCYDLNFILSPHVEAEITEDFRLIVRTKDGKRVLLTVDTKLVSVDGTDSGVWSVEPFSVSPRYGFLVDSTKLTFKIKTGGDLRICNTLTFMNS